MFRRLRARFNLSFRRRKFDELIQSFSFVRDFDAQAWNAEIRVKQPNFYALITALVRGFQEAGAVNFLTFTATDPATFETYTVIIKRHGGREAEEIAGILRLTLEQIASGAVDAQSEAGRVLELCGYKKAA